MKNNESGTAANGPGIVLVSPQMGENIGAAARAMLNCGLTDLRLVDPRDGWPNAAAEAMASGALEKMPPVRVFETVADAVADCHYVLATTARPRDMNKPIFTPRTAAAELKKRHEEDQKTALLFGAERAGLINDDVALAHGVVTIPLNPDFSSLNLGQAVLLMAWEWSQANISHSDLLRSSTLSHGEREGVREPPALHKDFLDLCERLEKELESRNFFRAGGQKPVMIRNLRSLLARADMTDQEVRTFHGIITALTEKKKT